MFRVPVGLNTNFECLVLKLYTRANPAIINVKVAQPALPPEMVMAENGSVICHAGFMLSAIPSDKRIGAKSDPPLSSYLR